MSTLPACTKVYDPPLEADVLGLATGFRTVTAVSGVVGLAVLLLNTPVWPAAGEFDGRLYANPETGCIESPPDDWNSADVIPVEPSSGADDPDRDDINEHLEDLPSRLRQGDAYVHAEPWPACDEPPRTAPIGAEESADR